MYNHGLASAGTTLAWTHQIRKSHNMEKSVTKGNVAKVPKYVTRDLLTAVENITPDLEVIGE